MPIAIPKAGQASRYHQVGESGNDALQFTLSDALAAYADDLLETGDVKLALERAFRWGFDDSEGHQIQGLQQRLQSMRAEHDRLRQELEDADVATELVAELDRIDAIDGRADVNDDSDASALTRLASRLAEGCDAPDAQREFEKLLGRLRESNTGSQQRGATGNGDFSSTPAGSASGEDGEFSGPGTNAAQARRIARMQFEGGVAAGQAAGQSTSWRSDIQQNMHRFAFESEMNGDEDQLLALQHLGSAIAELEQIASVLDIGKTVGPDLTMMLDGDTASWLAHWMELVATGVQVDPNSQRAGVLAMPSQVASAIGRELLHDLFRSAASPTLGDHRSVQRGNAGDPAEETVPWEFGRPLDLNLVSTVGNAIRRRGHSSDSTISLAPEDFAVVERNASSSVSTVLAIDRSRSMGQSGGWLAAKKVALAMNELIRQSYPRDALHLIAFSSSAEPVSVEALTTLDWDRFEHGTHLQGAIELSRILLRRSRGGTRQIVVITDGEPTLASVSGDEIFSTPPNDIVTAATLAAAKRCAKEGIIINPVMIGDEPQSWTLVNMIARASRGRVFATSRDALGFSLVQDYASR